MKEDMTKGNPMEIIIKFFIPMFIGNLFQQVYNVVDSIVVGRFIGSNAFAAVGSCFLVMNFVTSIIIGLSMGASTLYSKLFGAKDYENMKKAIVTGSIFIMAVSIILSLISLLNLDSLIKWFNMPLVTIEYSKIYLKFILGGLIFTGIYNIFAYLLRSIGDSKTPLVFLVVSCTLNIILDLVFVLRFNLGVYGVGLATVIAQGVSAILCFIYTKNHMMFLEFKKSDIRFDKNLFKIILSYSILTSLQQSISSFGMLMVQGIVNTFGPIVMAAFAACSKIDEFANRPLQDLSNAFSTYTAQNEGAKETERVRQGFKVTLKCIFVISTIVSLLAYIFAPKLMQIFVKAESAKIIAIGVEYLRIIAIFYVLLGLVVMFYSFYRGMGEMRISIMLTVFSQGVRVVLSYILASTSLGFLGVPLAVIIGWIASSILGIYFYKKIMKKKVAII